LLKDPWLKALIVLLVIIAASYLAGLVWEIALRFADIILMLVLAWALSFALEPIASFVTNEARITRSLAVAVVYLGLLIVLSAGTILLVPVVALQASQIGTNLPTYVDSIGRWVAQVQQDLPRQGALGTAIASLDYAQTARSIEALGPGIVNNAVSLATGVASVLFSLILVLMFSFYIMLDGGRFTAAFVRAIPDDRQDEVHYLIFSIHRAFGGFIRGQLIQAGMYALGTAAVMMIADLSYIAVAAIFAFAIMMVPFVGPVLGIIPPIVIALVVHPESTWWVVLLLLGLQQIILNVVAPRVMSQSVGVHPLLVLLALLIGGKLAGIWGAVFAVPVAGTLVAMVSFYRMTVEERAEQTKSAATIATNLYANQGPGEIADSASREA
jgi:predicted PurR-regulated permease PerM